MIGVILHLAIIAGIFFAFGQAENVDFVTAGVVVIACQVFDAYCGTCWFVTIGAVGAVLRRALAAEFIIVRGFMHLASGSPFRPLCF